MNPNEPQTPSPNNQDTAQAPQQVVDVTPPAPQPATQATTTDPATNTQVAEQQATEVVVAPEVSQEPMQDDQSAEQNTQIEQEVSTATEAQNSQDANGLERASTTPGAAQQQNTGAIKHKNPATTPIVIAVFVAIILSVIAVMVYINTDTPNEPTSNSNSNVVAPQEANTPNEVATDILSDVEATLNELDANADYPESELSDTSLGL